MAWKAVGPVVKKVVDRIVDVGETGVDAPAQPPRKGPEQRAPAKSFREVLPAKEVHANREMIIAPPNGLPRPAVIISLVVDNGSVGGRREEGGPCVRRLRRNSWSDRARELGLRVVG